MVKQYAALARVSSREQQREGFSLEVQEDALHRFAKQAGGSIIQFWKIAETASKKDERKAFKELMAYAKRNADKLDGVLFFKVDRAARNLFDSVELERLETDYNVPVIYVSQPTEGTPAGRMMRRTLANMAAFYTEQQSLDVRDGQVRRVQSGLFVSKASYGYRNYRKDGRSLIETHPVHGRKVTRIFHLHAYENHTIDSLHEKLKQEGITYTDDMPEFSRSKLHNILRDRAYLGELRYHDQWLPGTHEPLVDRTTFQRSQVLLGEAVYRSHDLTYACELIRCLNCDHPVTGERKTKQTKLGPKDYVYYRCSRYNAPGHPRKRATEAELDSQVLAMFDRIRIKDEKTRDWFLAVLRARTRDDQAQSQQRLSELNRQLTLLRTQQDRLLNLRLLDEISEQTFGSKNTEIRDRIAELNLQMQAADQTRAEQARLAEKVFELSQSLQDKWLTADSQSKRHLLGIVCLNFQLDGATLVPQMRKPFGFLAEGLSVLSSRGDKI